MAQAIVETLRECTLDNTGEDFRLRGRLWAKVLEDRGYFATVAVANRGRVYRAGVWGEHEKCVGDVDLLDFGKGFMPYAEGPVYEVALVRKWRECGEPKQTRTSWREPR